MNDLDKLNIILERAKDGEDEVIAERIIDWITTMYPNWLIDFLLKDKDLRSILFKKIGTYLKKVRA